jgi:hypothetical protein
MMPFFGKLGKVLIILARSRVLLLIIIKDGYIIKKIVKKMGFGSFDQRRAITKKMRKGIVQWI